MKNSIDINVDVGEGIGNELDIIPHVSSVNIACGGHAGNESTVKYILNLAKKYGVRVGAHPGFEDPLNFGRIPLEISISELRVSLVKQIDLIRNLATENGVTLNYIKPHGALYHLACSEESYARLFLDFLRDDMALMGLPKSVLESVCREEGIEFIPEGFADRVYEANGNLRKRTLEGSIHTSFDDIVNQVIGLCHNKVTCFTNERIDLYVDSICFHGDHKHSGKTIQKVVEKLKNLGVEIRS